MQTRSKSGRADEFDIGIILREIVFRGGRNVTSDQTLNHHVIHCLGTPGARPVWDAKINRVKSRSHFNFSPSCHYRYLRQHRCCKMAIIETIVLSVSSSWVSSKAKANPHGLHLTTGLSSAAISMSSPYLFL
jgi:uncharacterized protein (UPF0303 family)